MRCSRWVQCDEGLRGKAAKGPPADDDVMQAERLDQVVCVNLASLLLAIGTLTLGQVTQFLYFNF